MTSEKELDGGIAAIRSAYGREHNARNVLEHILDERERENAKLRELVRDMWSDLQKQLMPPWSGEYERRMRELGVEVDE